MICDHCGNFLPEGSVVCPQCGKPLTPRSRETGGTGLGLSIVRQMVKMHGGAISVNSEMGKGTEFVVTFPQEGALT